MTLKPWEIDKRTGANGPTSNSTSTGLSRGGQRSDSEIARTNRLRAQAAERWGDGSDEQNRAFVDNVWYDKAASGGSGSRMQIDSSGSHTGYKKFGNMVPGWTPNTPNRNPGPNNNSRGSGGGGYGGGMDKAKWASYQAGILDLIKGIQAADVGAAPVDLLSGLVNDGVDSSVADSNAAYGGVGDVTANAYRDVPRMAAPQFDPEIADLLKAQGMGTDYARAAQMQGQDELDDYTGLFGQYGDAMAATTDQWNTSRNADVDELAAHNAAQLEQVRTALLAEAGVRHQSASTEHEQLRLQAEYRAQQERRELALQLMREGLGNGMDMSGVDIAKLLGGA